MKNHLLFLPVIAFLLFLGNASISSGNNTVTILDNGHGRVYLSNTDSISVDVDPVDGKTDYHVKTHYTGNASKLYRIDIKVIDACVDGNTTEKAKLKVGFTKEFPYTWYTDGFKVWNPWFKSAQSNDSNKQIDLVVATTPDGSNVPFPFPERGDDVIQKNPKDKVGSFKNMTSIEELDGQAGWEGSIYVSDAPPGTYLMWSVFPASGNFRLKCESTIGLAISITTN